MNGSSYDDVTWAARYAQHADHNAYNAGYERPAIRRLLADLPTSAAVLDAGCAAGAQTAWLADRGIWAVGLDSSVPLLAIARERMPTVPLVRATLTSRLPFTEGCFDAVLCSLTLHYVEHWQPVLAEFARVLKPSGRLVVSTHHPVWDWPQRNPEDYFDRGPVERPWHLIDGEEMPARFYRRTIADVGNELARFFVLDRLEEPAPEPWVADKYPDDYKKLLTRPVFLLVAGRRREMSQE